MKCTVSVLIPVHNGLSFTRRCIQSIVDSITGIQEGSSTITLVVIDDGSDDGTSGWIKSNFPEIHILEGDGNLWWSGAVNKGVDYSLNILHTTYVLLWNNDVIPGEGYFSALIDFISQPEPCALACSMVFFMSQPDTLISTGGYFNSKTGKKGLYNYGKKETEALIDGLKLDWFGGMGTIIRNDVFHHVGYFDAVGFPQYHGDSDFGIRAVRAGYSIILNPRLKIWNDTGNTGLHNSMKINNFLRSFTSIKSNYNVKKDLLFYKKYTTSPVAYFELLKKYFIYCASYLKWKSLAAFGINKN